MVVCINCLNCYNFLIYAVKWKRFVLLLTEQSEQSSSDLLTPAPTVRGEKKRVNIILQLNYLLLIAITVLQLH